jgi:hypothetical protein
MSKTKKVLIGLGSVAVVGAAVAAVVIGKKTTPTPRLPTWR